MGKFVLFDDIMSMHVWMQRISNYDSVLHLTCASIVYLCVANVVMCK